MSPRIVSGALVTVVPCKIEDVSVDDVVLCRVAGAQYLHLVKAVGDGRVLIGNNKGGVNGWTRRVYGRVTKVVNSE